MFVVLHRKNELEEGLSQRWQFQRMRMVRGGAVCIRQAHPQAGQLSLHLQQGAEPVCKTIRLLACRPV